MLTSTRTRLIVSPATALRVDAAAHWLSQRPPSSEVLVVASSREASDELARRVTLSEGATFGVHRMTLNRLAAQLASPALAQRHRVPVSRLSFLAVVARTVYRLRTDGSLHYFHPVADRPGFPPAVMESLEELRMNGINGTHLQPLAHGGADLAALAERIDVELEAAGLADRSIIYDMAIRAVQEDKAFLPVGLPLLLLDVALASEKEAALVQVLAARSPQVLATAPHGDERSLENLEKALGILRDTPACGPVTTSLDALKAHLFEASAPEGFPLDDSVVLTSWPGEARECVEIARRLQGEAARGVPFDRMAILLHPPSAYNAHLEEALERAEIPAFFASGTRRPHASGRALLALLRCVSERLSARRFAEYLSLAQVPEPGEPAAVYVPPADDLLPLPQGVEITEDGAPQEDPQDGTLRSPWRWEQLLVESAVIGSLDRWRRRLDGLDAELQQQQAAIEPENSSRADGIARHRADLLHLRNFALPLLERLSNLPQDATWSDWLVYLRDVVGMALLKPDLVLRKLAELDPMGPVGPIGIDEVQRVLESQLRDISVPPPRRRYGAVFIAPTWMARGLSFDVVFVPGLSEKIFPHKIVEDPILLDADRDALPIHLVTQKSRVEAERLSLRLAVGGAARKAYLSYARIDLEQARPRVPSFYALEVMRAAEGKLPGFETLSLRATEKSGGRLGWPAPDDPRQAIDEAEYDLALILPLLSADPQTTQGTARYLLTSNDHLARALRARGRRWIPKWTEADGLVDPDALARAALQPHQLSARSYSPTALQNFAACPYRFFLQAVVRLAPRQEPAAIDELDPMNRGTLIHKVQYLVLTRLREAGRLPLGAGTLEEALALLDEALDETARTMSDELYPAIPRVWDDAINGIRSDLREWLRRVAATTDWTPDRFELSFGLAEHRRAEEDLASVPTPVSLMEGLQLRGSIDLIERHASGARRATDYKTGRVQGQDGMVVAGGQILQPLLYALACEALLGPPVTAGRLYYCTQEQEFKDRVVPLDERSRDIAGTVVKTVAEALEQGFFPAAPIKDACKYCDFRSVCGPHEERRTARKSKTRLASLMRLRELP